MRQASPMVAQQRMMMTLDAVGGVWRYAMDLAVGLRREAIHTCFVGLGPPPTGQQRDEALSIGDLDWLDEPLDWMVAGEGALTTVPSTIAALATQRRVDLLHLNLPSQAARLDLAMPVVAVSHSCVVTWFAAVRASAVPVDWRWQQALNARGFKRADAVVAPSSSHAAMLEAAYGPVENLTVIYNASAVPLIAGRKEEFAFAAGRWWDEGKNGAVLNAAAAQMACPLLTVGADRGPNGQGVTMTHTRNYGALPHADAMALMRRAAIVVSPSLYEPFGLAPLEAARCGAALVLADIPTYRELWDGAAVFAEPHRPAAFSKAVNRLLLDVGLRGRLVRTAQERAQRLTVDVQASSMARLYSNLLERKRASSAAE
ncbi:glycosyltransferase [Rhizobium grahamii]|uniref:Glycosyl transferase n=1 Tax=Rhizobium grahamii TaxID=1120045 RepID=A0A370KGC1_9HYPH|nr:glycosyltransferase [Rhizobium grahamii]RDJ03825.1 glycosyl transferase [Rhizobium grahamii]